MSTFRITWINSQNRVLVSHFVAATVAAAIASFRRSYPNANLANVVEA